MCGTAKQVKDYPFNKREREASCPRLDHRSHVASVYWHGKAQMEASGPFPENGELVQKRRAMRRIGLL